MTLAVSPYNLCYVHRNVGSGEPRARAARGLIEATCP